MIKILFDTRNWLVNINVRLHILFNNNTNFEAFTVFHNKLEAEQSQLKTNIYILNDYYQVGKRTYNINSLSELEMKYSIPSLWDIVYSDRYLRKLPTRRIIEYLSYYFYAYESIIKKIKPNFIISETVSGVWNYILYYVSKYYGAKYLGYMVSRTTEMLYFNNDILDNFQELEDKYSLERLSVLNKQKIERVNSFLRSIESNSIPKYTQKTIRMNRSFNEIFTLQYIKKYLKLKLRKKSIAGDLTFEMSETSFLNKISQIIKSKFILRKNFFDKPVPSEKYIIFFLHYQPEATTDIWSSMFSDQITVLKYLSRSIPIDYKLYVKEHGSFLGFRKLSEYKKIRALKNVRLIGPDESNIELIKNSSLVVTLSGTVGLEAIFFNIPVLIFGKPFYRIYKNIHFVKDLYELPKQIKAILNTQIDQDERYKFIYAYLNSGYDVKIFSEQINSTIIEKLYQSILTEINKITEYKS